MKTALVTGAASGIGAAIARRLAAEGVAVAVNFRNRPPEAVIAAIEAAGGTAFAVQGDAATDSAAIVAATIARFGGIDILVNNAGAIEAALLGAIEPDSFTRQFSANTLSVLLMMQAALPHFPASGGRIINISSSLAMAPVPSTAVYSASKAAVNTLTQCFARELGGRKITVNAIAPGATETPMTAGVPAAIHAKIAADTPLGRWAAPDDIAATAAFLASDGACFITGRIITVDGGLIA
jgi:3-oxoacyl-[acyl-carrier protein] reductase